MGDRTRTAVHWFSEGGFLVRGTLDPHTALQFAVNEGEPWHLGNAFEMGSRPDEENGDQPTSEEIGELRDRLHGYLSTAKPGLYRIVPAHPDNDEYGWFIHPARTRGRGVFEGVAFW